MTPEITQLIGSIKDVVVGIAAAVAAYIAFQGLSAWRRELKGKSEYQLAKEVLRAAYKVREAFKHIRHIAIYSYEYPEGMRDYHGHLKRENEHEGTAYVYKKRWEKLDEAFRELEEKHLEAQVEWGAKFQDVIVPLRTCRAELLVAIQMMLDRKKNPYNTAPRKAEEIAEERSVLYHIGEESKYDKFTPQINEAVDKFEQWLRPHITRKA